MQFKHPEILYALFLLLIPIIIHLFQLRRFQKTYFTNVAFLKKVTLQTRKSSQIKKWLTLLLRLLVLGCLIIAFAQPYSTSSNVLNRNSETIIYVDNSFSMQAKGDNGPLLQRAVQDLLSYNTSDEKISWYTNDNTYKNLTGQDFRNTLLEIDFSPQEQLSPTQVLIKANQLFSKNKAGIKKLLYISDFQNTEAFPEIPKDMEVLSVQLKPKNISNVSIDSIFIQSITSSITHFSVKLKHTNQNEGIYPVSVYNGSSLVAKTGVDFSKYTGEPIVFDINTSLGFDGRIELIDQGLQYDNTLFFNLNLPKKIKVLAINGTDGTFLKNLFKGDEFQFSPQPFDQVNYDLILNQNLIVLNELKEIPTSLSTILKSFVNGGGHLLIIPSVIDDVSSYNFLLNSLQIGGLKGKVEKEKIITKISFSHPLFQNVFEKRVLNFQFPKVNSYYDISFSATPILSYGDGKPFILQKGPVYLFTAPINVVNSNFQASPLIVPTFYNMAAQSLPLPKLYYTIGNNNNYAVPVLMPKDEILSLKIDAETYIPQQRTQASYVEIITTEEPSKAGTYNIVYKDSIFEKVSYNYNRNESELQYANADKWQGAENFESIEKLLGKLDDLNTIDSYWKWFVIFALLFLILETLVLKFLKS